MTLFSISLNKFVMRKMMLNVLSLAIVGLMQWKPILLTWKKTLEEADKAKHQENIDSNMNHLNNLKG